MLSTLPEEQITLNKARGELHRVDDPDYWDVNDDLFCDLELIPEIAAGAVGYALSPLRRDGLHVMVDIGASTVDVCTFVLNTSDWSNRYSLLIADVQQIGTARVHFERVAAIKRACEHHAKQLNENFDALAPLSEDLKRYLIPEQTIIDVVQQAHDDVIKQVNLMLRRTIWKTKVHRYRSASEWTTGTLPVLVIGGGSHVPSFRSAVDQLDAWLRKHTENKGVSVLPVPVPESFKSSRRLLNETDLRRLAVAWGLSHRSLDVGDIIPADKIPDEPPPRERRWRDRYVGKEVV